MGKMDKTPLLLIKDHSTITELNDQLDAQLKIYQEKMTFIKKQEKTAQDELEDKSTTIWNTIKEYLIEHELIKDKDVRLQLLNGVLFQVDKNHMSPIDLLSKLFED
jgi:hypothetical protein